MEKKNDEGSTKSFHNLPNVANLIKALDMMYSSECIF